MKKETKCSLFTIVVVALFSVLTAGCGRSSVICVKYYLHNVSGQDIVVVNTFGVSTDSVALKNGDYYKLFSLKTSKDEANLHNLNGSKPLYIYLNDTCYQVDRNDANSCLWADSYREGTDEEYSTFSSEDIDWIQVYDLTETNIKSQIHKQ